MTDAHYHRDGFDTLLSLNDRVFRFFGFHPWQAEETLADAVERLRYQLAEDAHAGVGEIGMDRLKSKTISERQRRLFEEQLDLAAELRRPVVLHGAKCWGEVVGACRSRSGRIPALLFHGFSRSGGLLPQIGALNGFVSVGAAVLNDHAVNYRELVKDIPLDRLLVESDFDWESPSTKRPAASQGELLADIVRKVAELRNRSSDELAAVVDANAARFVEALA